MNTVNERIIQIAVSMTTVEPHDKYGSNTETCLYALTSNGRIFRRLSLGEWINIPFPLDENESSDVDIDY